MRWQDEGAVKRNCKGHHDAENRGGKLLPAQGCPSSLIARNYHHEVLALQNASGSQFSYHCAEGRHAALCTSITITRNWGVTLPSSLGLVTGTSARLNHLFTLTTTLDQRTL